MWWQQHQLGSKNPETRRKAAARLSEKPRAVSLAVLVASTRDTDREVRRLSVIALGKREEPNRVDALLDTLRDADSQVACAGLTALRKINDSRVAPAAAGLLRHPDAAVRGGAAQVLEFQLWQPTSDEEAAWLHVARGHFTRAAEIGPLALPALEVAIRNGPFSVAVGAVKALAEIGGARITRPLIAALKAADSAVIIAALETLARAGLGEAAEHVLPLLKHRDSHVRLAAAETLGSLRTRDSASALLPLLNDASWDVRRATAETLGRLRDPRCLEALCAALKDPDTDVREAAAIGLASFSDPRAIPALVLSLGDPASGVRRLSAAALARLDENWSDREDARQAATDLLSTLPERDSDAAYFLRQVLDSRPRGSHSRVQVFSRAEAPNLDPDHRRKLAASLFQNLLVDAEDLVRLAAAEALGRLREPKSEGALVRALADSNASVRLAAETAIHLLRTT